MMDIHINLLPEKPKKNYFLIFIFGISFGLLVVAATLGVLYYQSIQQEYARIQDRIQTTIQLQDIHSSRANDTQNLPQIGGQVESLLEDRVLSTYILNQLVSQLPRNAYYLDYSYDE